MSNPHLDAALALSRRLLASVVTAEESRDVQRRSLGAVLPKTERQLLERRRLLAAALLEASRLSRDEGQETQALALLREHAMHAHLVEQGDLRASAGR